MNTSEKSLLADTFEQLSSMLPSLNMQCVECRTQITNVQSARHAYLNNLTESTLPNLSKSTYRLLLKLQLSHPGSVLLSPALDTAFNDSGLLFGFWPGARYKQTLAMARIHLKRWLDSNAHDDLAVFNDQINALEMGLKALEGQILQVKSTLRLLKSALDNSVMLPLQQCDELREYATHLRILRQGAAVTSHALKSGTRVSESHHPKALRQRASVASYALQAANQGAEPYWAYNLTPFPINTRSYLLQELNNLPDTSEGTDCIISDEYRPEYECEAPDDTPNHFHDQSNDLPGADAVNSHTPIIDTTTAIVGLAAAGIAYSLETHGAYS